MTPVSVDRVRQIRDLDSLIGFLRDELGWPAPDDLRVEEMAYDYRADELRLDTATADRVKVRQLAPFVQGQPWGIFLVETNTPKVYATYLRKILRGLGPRQRQRPANLKAWNAKDLLFICTTPTYDRFTFAHFKGDKAATARLSIFGWDRGDVGIRTLCEYNLPALRWPQTDLTSEPARQRWLQEWMGAFDKEKLTKTFFRAFTEAYTLLAQHIEKHNRIRRDAAGNEAQILLNRFLFLYFIQKKGWLNGDKNFLLRTFQQYDGRDPQGDSFHREFVNDLFAALSHPGASRDGLGSIPFLNGGLFEVERGEATVGTRVRIKNEAFREIFASLFERYNFTVREDTPLDVEVAVDPEMLGQILERLVLAWEKKPDIDLRKLTGSYYTPRTIVRFMCQESLKAYLLQRWREGYTAQPVDNRLPLTGFSGQQDFADLILEQQERAYQGRLRALLENDDASMLSPAERRTIRDLLLSGKIVDPAVGSGAFLVGMLHEMIRLIRLLDTASEGTAFVETRNYDYRLKERIIRDCLYGVDVQEQAVRICELRLWLSLMVDYDRAKGEILPTLPNLTYRVRQGNSLLDQVFGETVTLQRDKLPVQQLNAAMPLIDAIKADKEKYFGMESVASKHQIETRILTRQCELARLLLKAKADAATNALNARFPRTLFDVEELTPAQREEHKALQIGVEHLDALQAKAGEIAKQAAQLERRPVEQARAVLLDLRRQLGAFVWQLDFAELFRKPSDGFDICIANPPYVRADIGEEYLAMRREILNSGAYETLWEKWDFYVAFLERGFKLLRQGGILEYITSDAYTAAKYARKSQEWFIHNAAVLRVDFLSDVQIFEAGVRNVILAFQRLPRLDNVPQRVRHHDHFGNAESLPTKAQGELGVALFRLDGAQPRAETPQGVLTLQQVCFVSVGMVTNSNEKGYKGLFTTDDLLSEKKDAKHPKPFVEGKDLMKWYVQRVRFLEWGSRRVPSKLRRPTFPQLHEASEKLLAVRTPGAVPKVAYDCAKIFYDASSVGFVPWHLLKGVKNKSICKVAKYRGESGKAIWSREELEEISTHFSIKYLLAIVNSTFACEWLARRRRSKMHVYPDDWKDLPIAAAPEQTQAELVALVEKILAQYKQYGHPLPQDAAQQVQEIESEINHKVSVLYEAK